jgi:predicted nicotinamide N-methyase
VAGHSFRYQHPDGLARLFDDPIVTAAFHSDGYIPYWADLWPAALMAMAAVLAEPWQHRVKERTPLRAVEIGCGLGLAGIAALKCGLHVTFTDVDRAAVELAASNARFNGFTDFDAIPLDLRATPAETFSVILGADVLYEQRMLAPLLSYLKHALEPGGLALITDGNRQSAQHFADELLQHGFAVQTKPCKVPHDGQTHRGTLYRIQHAR